jgi:glycosyltransferase involved in cell wall biosynthesis
VLGDVCSLREYKDFYHKTVFYGPLFDLPTDAFGHLGPSGKLLFSSHDRFDAGNYAQPLGKIIEKYNIDIVYGIRELVSEFDITCHNTIDVINVGTRKMNHTEVDKFKYTLWKDYGIESSRYESNWDFEQYLRIAIPYLEILEGLYGRTPEYFHFSHEYMGVPSVLSVLSAGKKEKTIFVAHEVTTARSIVENNPGHDITFYNLLQSNKSQKSLEDVFGSQKHNYRSELVKRAVHCDKIFAVGDHVKDEYLFLVPQTPPEKIEVVYNGVSAKQIDMEQKRRSRSHIEMYTDALFNFVPDVILTHVTRLVPSKGVWRDIALLYHLDKILDAKNLKGVYILVSTLIATGRSPSDVMRMESDYGWPVLHRDGWPDLIATEKDIYEYLQLFNSRSKAIKGVFINQFGFNRHVCGMRVPEEAEFADLRIASDAEFGFSTYEPFGIAQIEVVPFGGVSVMSSSCGSAGFLVERFADAPIKPFCILDFIEAGRRLSNTALKNLSIQQRTAMEDEILAKNAQGIFDSLPLGEQKRQQYLDNALKYISRISWEASAKSYISF